MLRSLKMFRYRRSAESCGEKLPIAPTRRLAHALKLAVDFSRRNTKGAHLSIRIVRLGSARLAGEGLRIGTVRRPPRGVRKTEYASRNYYDVWLPVLAPSAQTVKLATKATTDREWARFRQKYRAEMASPPCRATLDLLAALSHQTDFSVGCYCADESHCHRAVLRELLEARGARVI
ncbi:MAG: hypothetical protein JWN94_3436 [Betaproteobacteria bacterium]|nr:hypothetical protein [Betaproteobacteria bacterium]